MRVIAVDTGNRLIKTPHFAFNAGLVRHGKRAPAIKTDMLRFGEEYFTLTEQRSPYLKDKTTDDTYFILALFGIAKELVHLDLSELETHKICLAVGLPPSHLPIYKESFARYFISHGKEVEFEYNNKEYRVEISRVVVYPQGFSAAADMLSQVKDYPRAYIVDIGGYTTDVVLLSHGKPDMSFCHSFNFGVIHMNNEVKRIVSARHDQELEDVHVESTLMGNETLPADIRETIFKEASAYADEMLRSLKEKGVNPAINMLVFIGGGAELFKNVLAQCPNTIYKTDVCANAIGYAKLACASMGVPYEE